MTKRCRNPVYKYHPGQVKNKRALPNLILVVQTVQHKFMKMNVGVEKKWNMNMNQSVVKVPLTAKLLAESNFRNILGLLNKLDALKNTARMSSNRTKIAQFKLALI